MTRASATHPPGKNRPQKTFTEIDILKAFSALTVIFIHVTGSYRSIPYVHSLWVWSHFAVGAFVVASGFLQEIHPVVISGVIPALTWLATRIKRLVLPYYGYVFAHASLIFALPAIFDRYHPTITFPFLRDTILLIGGFGQNWIPRLFVMIAVTYLTFQFIKSAFKRTDRFYWILYAFSLAISLFFLIQRPESSKYTMIFTWYALFLLGGIIYRHRSNTRLLKLTGLMSGIIFLALYTFYFARGISTSIFPHKYPPSLYFLAYNTAVVTILYAAGSRIQSEIVSHPIVGNAVRFISRHSYSIFFVHIIVLDALHKPSGFWLSDFLIISAATVLTVYVLNYSSTALVSFFKTRRHGA